MKKLVSALVFALLAVPSLAQAHTLTFEAYDACGKRIVFAEATGYEKSTVFEATAKVLATAGVKLETEHTDDKSRIYVSSIDGLKEKSEDAGDSTKAWGWNASLNGTDLKESPGLVELPEGHNKIKWTYGYLLINNETGNCDADNCTLHPTKEECAAPKADAK